MTVRPDFADYEIILRHRPDGVEAILRELDLQAVGPTADVAVSALQARFSAVSAALAEARDLGLEPDPMHPRQAVPAGAARHVGMPVPAAQPSAARELLMFAAKLVIVLVPVALVTHLLVKRVENMPKPWKAQYLLAQASKASAMTPEQIEEVRQALRIVVRQYGPLLQELRPLWAEIDGAPADGKKP